MFTTMAHTLRPVVAIECLSHIDFPLQLAIQFCRIRGSVEMSKLIPSIIMASRLGPFLPVMDTIGTNMH